MEDFENWIEAGKIAKEALEYGKRLAKPGIKLLELAKEIEGKIKELGGKLAFPVNLSLNNIAAHSIPMSDDERVLKEDDILKIDVGVHVNGCIGDTACTVGNNKKLIMASEDALTSAIEYVKRNANKIVLCEIGRIIQEKIQSYGFSPIRNLSGHSIDKYNLHSGLTIPNYDNGDTTSIEGDFVFAIEPFATDGKGIVKDGKYSGIYRLEEKRPTRNPIARKVLEHIEKEFNGLPFSKRWLLQFKGINFALNTLEKEGILHHYKELKEEGDGLVSQAEHTILIKDGKAIVTTS